MEDNYHSKVSTGYFTGILKAVAVSLIFTFVILLIAALLLCFTDFPEHYSFPSAIAATVLGVFIGSYMSSKKNPDKSLVSSLLTAFIYIIISYIIGCILGRGVSFTLNSALFAVIALITGAVASILSNRRSKTYHRSNSKIIDKRQDNRGTRRYKTY